MLKTKKLINDGGKAVDEMLEGILAAHPAPSQSRRRQPALDHRPRRPAPGQGRPGDRRRLGPRADLSRLRRQGAGRRGGDRQCLRLAAARPDPRMRQGGQRRRRRAFHVRQLCRRRHEFRHGGRDGGDGRHRGAHGADHRRRRFRAARRTGTSAAASPAISSSSRRPAPPATACCPSTNASASPARPTTTPSPWAWRLSPCSLPQTRRPNFEIGADEMEIGMGIHGEPGVARGPLKTADEITDEMLDQHPRRDGAGARRPGRGAGQFARLDAADGALHHEPARASSGSTRSASAIHATWVGNYCTSLEMAGASVTLHASRRRVADDARPPLRLRHVSRRVDLVTARNKTMTTIDTARLAGDVRGHRRRHVEPTGTGCARSTG